MISVQNYRRFGWPHLIVLALVFLIYYSIPSTWPAKYQIRYLFSPCSNDSMIERSQADPCLHGYIRQYFQKPPTSEIPYSAEAMKGSRGNEFTTEVAAYFNNMKNGTFIEVGAYDGLTASNTFFLEKELQWRGILIECNPEMLPKLLLTNRKAWITQSCLSHTAKMEIVQLSTLKEWPASAQLHKGMSVNEMENHGLGWVKDKTWHNHTLPAFPLYSIIMATEAFDSIDFLSIDVQGIEIEVLNNFPFDKFNIKFIVAEVHMFSDIQQTELKASMQRKGYKLYKSFQFDYAFVYSPVN